MAAERKFELDLTDADDMILDWLEDLFEKELKETKESMLNEEMIMYGVDDNDPELKAMHKANLERMKQYSDYLLRASSQIHFMLFNKDAIIEALAEKGIVYHDV